MARRRVEGNSRLRRKLRRFPEELRREIRGAMEDGGRELRDELEARAPKDEGDLSRAAHYVVSRDGLSVRVGYGTAPGFKRKWKSAGGFVALFAEFGTKHHKAQPFIRRSYRAKLKDILNRIDTAVNNTLRRASSGMW